MRNLIWMMLVMSIAVGCGCNRKEEKKEQPKPQFTKTQDNSYGGLPHKQPEPRDGDSQCLEEGETGNQRGDKNAPDWELKKKCCEGLVDREEVDICGKGITGGYVYACIKCGDGVCDSNNESKCNCPEDCQ